MADGEGCWRRAHPASRLNGIAFKLTGPSLREEERLSLSSVRANKRFVTLVKKGNACQDLCDTFEDDTFVFQILDWSLTCHTSGFPELRRIPNTSRCRFK